MTNDAEKHLPFEEPNGEFERKVQRMENVKRRRKEEWSDIGEKEEVQRK